MIYYFGDSHTAGMKYQNTIKDYSYQPYPYYLSQKLGMTFKNMASPGNNLVYNVNFLIKNLKEIINNGKIVIFQFQFFHNAYFRINNSNLQWKDFVMHINRPVDDIMKEYNISLEDANLLLSYLDKFEESRSWYEMERVYSIFDLLNEYNIKCYALYWCKPTTIDIIHDDRNITFNDKQYVQELNQLSIAEETNNKWNDGHMGNIGNMLLAEKIHNYILNS